MNFFWNIISLETPVFMFSLLRLFDEFLITNTTFEQFLFLMNSCASSSDPHFGSIFLRLSTHGGLPCTPRDKAIFFIPVTDSYLCTYKPGSLLHYLTFFLGSQWPEWTHSLRFFNVLYAWTRLTMGQSNQECKETSELNVWVM